MSVPAYLMGTQTAGLLSQPAGTQAQTPYVPGTGMAPMAATAPQQPQSPSSGGTFNALNYSGLTDYEKQKLASLASGNDFFMADSFMNSIKNKYNDPMTVIGQGEAWLTPDELRAKTNALESNLFSGQGGGSGGGGDGSGAGGAAGGGGLGAAGSGAGTGQVGGGLGGLLNNVTGAANTAAPGSLNPFPNVNTGTIGTGQVGGGTGQVSGGSIPGTSNQVGGGAVPMMQAGAGNALNNYYNTAGYQLTNGQGAVNQFQTSPGYQFAVDQALGQVARQGASRGLLDSGAGLRAMTDRAQGMANQEFNNWQQNQQNQYNQYQNRLQGLAGGPTGAEMAYGLGQNVGANNMATGNNIGSILANQGNSLFGGIVGAGGAQAQNVTQAGNMQAQILGSNLQTQMMLAALAAGQQGAR